MSELDGSLIDDFYGDLRIFVVENSQGYVFYHFAVTEGSVGE